ncbi:MAG: phosphopantetheine-binding protein [Culturomica sp.]|jgi:acyl carrier protein|nr:phosphopantetheine-binding protein [Culturomica sp.]
MQQEILEILTEIRPEFDFTQDIDFVEQGMLDSFDLVSLVDALDEKFGISISGADILPENFSSLASMETLINKTKNI